MESYTISLILLPIVILTLCYLLKNSPKTKLPPGPKPWPVIGNIHLLGSKPHHSVTKLSQIYGPLMSLKLGRVTAIVISSPEVAKEMFLKHDLAFSSRPSPDASKALDYDKLSIVGLPVCPKWRNLRKIVAVQLFTTQRLDASQGLRKKKVDELVQFAKGCSTKGLAIDIGHAASTTSLNLLSNTIFSMDFASYDSSVSEEFKDLAWHFLEEAGRPNVSDFFPLLRAFDLQGVRRRAAVYFHKMMGILKRIIDERLREETAKEDVLGTLLKIVTENELTLEDVKILLLDLFIAGTDTTSSTLDWAMTELLRNQEKMAKAQAEIDQVIGSGKLRSIEESDISRLPYIQAVVKETLRLHPPAPFLIPHGTENDVQLYGYHVPKNARIWVNVWSMGRDSRVWENPELFVPERFLMSEIDFKGRNFELIPFGAGRRVCPGMPLAHRMVHLMLATLLHSFNWKLENGLKPEDIDTEDKFGMTLERVKPLQAIPVAR